MKTQFINRVVDYCLTCEGFVAQDPFDAGRFICRCTDPSKPEWVPARLRGELIFVQKRTLYTRMSERLIEEFGSYNSGSYSALSDNSKKAMMVLDEFKDELQEKK